MSLIDIVVALFMLLIDIVVALFMLPFVFIWFMIDMYDTLFGRH